MKKANLIELQPFITLLTIFVSLAICPDKLMAADKILIFPLPQQIQLTGDIFVLDETISIVVPQNMSKNDIFLARFLVRELSDKYGVAVKIEPRTDIPKNRKTVVMGRFDNPLIQGYCKEKKLDVSDKNPGAEGYILQVNPDIIIIAGSDDQGAFYGLQSLRQLIDAGNGKAIQGVKVTDWPAFAFRGIRFYVAL
jgi:hypothetical protein